MLLVNATHKGTATFFELQKYNNITTEAKNSN